MGYQFKHDAVCPRCHSEAMVSENGSASGDFVDAYCPHCDYYEVARMEEEQDLFSTWQAQSWADLNNN